MTAGGNISYELLAIIVALVAMSALGHKRTFCDAGAMSALPSKADIRSAPTHVRFVPIADIRTNLVRQLFDHLVARVSSQGVTTPLEIFGGAAK
jgi:hypothetical protein